MRGRGSVSSCQSDLTLAGDWTREAGPGAEAGHNRWPEIRVVSQGQQRETCDEAETKVKYYYHILVVSVISAVQ